MPKRNTTPTTQALHDELYAADRHCANMGGRCSRQAVVDVHVDMAGRELALRLCGQHGRRTVERGLRNATVLRVTSI